MPEAPQEGLVEVWRIDAEMTRHDLGMTRFRQWWRRQYRSGYNGLDILTRFPGEDRALRRRLEAVASLGDRLAPGGGRVCGTRGG